MADTKCLNIKKLTEDIMISILDEREQILRAFLAKHGMHPDEAVQVITFGSNTIEWRVERRKKEGK